MKVLLVGLERVGKQFSMESLFKKKLTEADMTDVEVVTAEMTELGSPGGRKLERSMNEALRDEADFVGVMEPWQKDLLTRFMDYRNWHKIHLFADICKRKSKADMPSCGRHSIFRHDNFIGCFSADKIKMSVRKYFCFNIPIDKNMAEGLFCRSPYHEEYIQTSASGNPEDLCH